MIASGRDGRLFICARPFLRVQNLRYSNLGGIHQRCRYSPALPLFDLRSPVLVSSKMFTYPELRGCKQWLADPFLIFARIGNNVTEASISAYALKICALIPQSGGIKPLARWWLCNDLPKLAKQNLIG